MTACTLRWAVLALPLVLVGAVEAATLFTAPVSSGGTASRLRCWVINVSDTPRTIRARILFVTGSPVLADSGDVTVGPGGFAAATTGNGAFEGYCRIDVVGTKGTVRGALTVEGFPTTTTFGSSAAQ
jgi:hypothetical protein